jgi:hypothetical protein
MRAIIYFTGMFYICCTTATIISRLKNPEHEENITFSSRLKRAHEQADESFCSKLGPNKKARVDQIITDTFYDEDCLKLIENLNYAEWDEPSVEELNKISLKILDSESVEKYFEAFEQSRISKQTKYHNNEINHKDHLNFSATNFAENDIENLSDENFKLEIDHFNFKKEIIASSNENENLKERKISNQI